MIRYIGKRLAWTIVVIWAVATLTFVATFLSPIDPARAYAGPRASLQVYEAVRKQFGLDQPVVVQYWRFMSRLAQGNLGRSFSTDQPVLSGVLSRLPATAELALAAMFVQIAVGVPLGVIAALHRDKPIDRSVLVFSLGGVVTPAFVLGFVLLYLLAYEAQVFPLGGSGSPAAVVLPALSLGLAGACWYARMVRSTTLGVLGEDHVRTARAKGLPSSLVLRRHILRPSLGPLITMIGLDLGVFLGGVLVIEKVFGWPGIGQQAWQAISNNDIPMVMGTVLVAAVAIALLNLVADVANALVDPRTTYN